MRQCVEDVNILIATFYPDTGFFLLSPLVFKELLPHGDHLHSLRKRMTTTPSGGTQTTTLPFLFSLAPTPAATIACIRGPVKLCFFFSFFRFFSDHCRDLFSPHAGSSNPHLFTMPRPSSPASPATAIASFADTQVKICFFLFFFFVPFLTNVTETLFTPHAGSSNPRLSTT